MFIGFRFVFSGGDLLRMGGVQPSKLAESSTVTGLSYLEDGQFAKIYKVSFLDIFDSLFFPLQEGKTQSFGFLADGM